MAKTAWTALCAALFMGTLAPNAQAEPNVYGIGPLVLGMSFDEARAQTPDAVWQDVHTSIQSQRARIASPEAFEFDGLRFGADLQSDALGAYTIRANAQDASATDASLCEARALRVLSSLEARIGVFTNSQPGIGFQQAAEPVRPRWGATTIRNSNGVMAVPYITYEGGAPAILARRATTLGGSFAYVATWNRDQSLIEPRDLTSRRIARYAFTAQRREAIDGRTYSAILNAQFQRGFDCQVTIQLQRDGVEPPAKS